MSFIECEGIQKYYLHGQPGEVHALKGVDLRVEQGEMTAIQGRSGSGKSTLLHIMGCLDNFQEGEYRLEGESVSGLDQRTLAHWRNRKIGFVLQDFGLILSKTAADNVAVPLLFDPEVKAREIPARVEQLLEEVGLPEKRNVLVNQLSGGQKQRVAIARALANHPPLLLADEPTGSLDSKTAEEIMDLLCSLNEKGVTMLLSTHAEEVAARCKRILRLEDGRIV